MRFAEKEGTYSGGAVAPALHERWRRFAAILAGPIYDFDVYSAKKKREKLECMHENPVKRGLVKDPGAWRWSSFLF